MRYNVYKNLIGLTETLVEAMTYVKANPNSIQMIIESGNALIAIKNSLEINKEKIIDEVNIFLETIDVIADYIEGGQDYKNEINKLYDLAVIIEKYCKEEIKYKFRIIFFAELGSKWDSMDSVYRAYKIREDCDVAVVLTPIFRALKLPNGEIKSDVIYKDYLTNMGIPFIPFDKYDIKKDMPDMVFTSQPYESVTPENFWAENVAPYTRLVYLPYFTSNGIIDDNQKLVQCQMPIHNLAWKVVCQSEKHKEAYSKYSQNKGKNAITFGLPKWDWVINMKDRNIKLPKGWEKLKGKKVILRNVHYTTAGKSFTGGKSTNMLINEPLVTAEKYEGTDIAYIYRMHPMTETMFKVYYPEYLEEWEKLKKVIEKSGNVVIDFNETYDYAFKFSDILFSEPSSLVSQYVLTKKPVVMYFWWKGNIQKRKELENSEDTLIKYTELYCAEYLSESDKIRDNIFNNNDYEYEKRMDFIKKYMNFADGHIGEKLSRYLIEEILREDNLL